MILVYPSVEVLTDISPGGVSELTKIEQAGRICYKSENINDDFEVTKDFVANIIRNGHLSVLEHGYLTVKIVTDRGVSHELVRHRLASYSQESTRYCNYSKAKFGEQLTFVRPTDMDFNTFHDYFIPFCQTVEKTYMDILNNDCTAQIARAVLPNCLKTEVVMTANYREWRHILDIRCAPTAHPDMQTIMKLILKEFSSRIPVIFDDLAEKYLSEKKEKRK